MEDYFCAEILACVPVFSLSLSSPFLFLVVADTLGKQFVSHLIAFEKLKTRITIGQGWGMRTGGTLTP